jgi:hypothetical protein
MPGRPISPERATRGGAGAGGTALREMPDVHAGELIDECGCDNFYMALLDPVADKETRERKNAAIQCSVQRIVQAARPVAPDEVLSPGDCYALERDVRVLVFGLIEQTSRVMIIDEATGRKFWPVGVRVERLKANLNEQEWRQVEKWLHHFRQPHLKQIKDAVEECARSSDEAEKAGIVQTISQCWLGVTAALPKTSPKPSHGSRTPKAKTFPKPDQR